MYGDQGMGVPVLFSIWPRIFGNMSLWCAIPTMLIGFMLTGCWPGRMRPPVRSITMGTNFSASHSGGVGAGVAGTEFLMNCEFGIALFPRARLRQRDRKSTRLNA